jgi:Ca2+:H+ antiporter
MTAERRAWRGPSHPIDYLLVFVPLAAAFEFAHASPTIVFVMSALAIVPLAGLMGRATEQLAHRAGPGVGGLLNATFGNAAELIIAVIGLSRGLGEVVKASITGSIIGNILLVLGLSLLAGGVRHPVQRFNKSAASMGATLLALSAIGMIVPTLFWYAARDPLATHAAQGAGTIAIEPLHHLERGLSLEIAVILGIVYVLSLIFSLRTHKHLYAGDTVMPEPEALANGERGAEKPVPAARPVILLLVSSALVAVLSEFLVGALEPTAKALGLTDLFVGVIVVAIVGNAAEHASAVFAALKNHVDLAFHIAVGSSLQIALFVTPVLVGLSYFIGPRPMDLHFTMFEVGAVALAVFAVNLVAQDGESNWMEGVMLMSVYAILGIAFYFLPA